MSIFKKKKTTAKTTAKATKKAASKKTIVKKTAANKKSVTKSKKKKFDEAALTEWVKTRAYFIWEERGKPAGQEQDIWLQAQSDVAAMVK